MVVDPAEHPDRVGDEVFVADALPPPLRNRLPGLVEPTVHPYERRKHPVLEVGGQWPLESVVFGDAPPEVEARRHHLPRIADDVDEVGLREDAADQGHAEGMQWVLEHEAAVVLELDRPQEAEPRGDPAVAIVGRKAFKRLVRWVGGRIVWEGHGPPRTRQAEVAEREFVFLGAVESHGHVVHGSPFGEQKPQSLAGKLFREDKVARHAALHGRRGNKRRIAGQQLVEERRAAPPVAENHDRVVLDPCRPQTPAPHRPLDAREHLVAEGCGRNADGPMNS